MHGGGLSGMGVVTIGGETRTKPPEAELSRLVGSRRKQLDYGHELATQAEAVAERLGGSVPMPSASGARASVPANGLIGVLADLEGSGDELNARLAAAIERLTRLV